MEDELARRRASRTVPVPPREPGRQLSNTVRAHEVTYQVPDGISAKHIVALVEWVEEVAEGLQWGVLFIDDNGPELDGEPWENTSVWVTASQVRAVLSGGVAPRPILLRADAPEGVGETLVRAHIEALGALSRAADYA